MANVSKINGFSPVKHLNGSPYNGQATIYSHSSGDATALFVGDVVKLVGSGNAQGIQYVTASTAGTAGTGLAAVGVVVGVINTKLDPVTGKMTNGSIALDTPQYVPASTEQYLLVADATDVIYEVEATTAGSAYTFTAADVGLNANLYAGAGSTATGNSAYSLDMADSGTTATLPFKIVGVSQRPDNAMATTAVKVLVQLNNSQFKGGTGTVGV
jgi:hypothetical protein